MTEVLKKLTRALQTTHPWLFKTVKAKCGAKKDLSLEERDAYILRMVSSGTKYDDIAKEVGLSTIRVKQIIRGRKR